MFDVLLAKTVAFPMNALLPLFVVWALIMAVREALPKYRIWKFFWFYIFFALVCLAIGWPPQFMQDAVLLPEATAATLP